MCFALTLNLDHPTLGLVGWARSSTYLGRLILGRNGSFCRSAADGLHFSGPSWCSFLQRQIDGQTFSLSIRVAMIVTATMWLTTAGPMTLNRQPARKLGKKSSTSQKDRSGEAIFSGPLRQRVSRDSLHTDSCKGEAAPWCQSGFCLFGGCRSAASKLGDHLNKLLLLLAETSGRLATLPIVP
jgi:hypothetical protein